MRRNVVIALLLAVLIAVVQVVGRAQLWIVLLSAAIAFLLSLVILAISDRYGRRD